MPRRGDRGEHTWLRNFEVDDEHILTMLRMMWSTIPMVDVPWQTVWELGQQNPEFIEEFG
jgi:hypothetical protein